jgi:hypothetical protein
MADFKSKSLKELTHLKALHSDTLTQATGDDMLRGHAAASGAAGQGASALTKGGGGGMKALETVDLEQLAFKDEGRTMTNKRCVDTLEGNTRGVRRSVRPHAGKSHFSSGAAHGP